MKDIIDIRDVENKENEQNKMKKRKMNKKKMIIAICIVVLLLIVGITMLLYYSSRDVRNFLDQYLFRKNVTEEKLNSIALEYDSNVSIFAYNKYICVLAENKLMEYNTSGNLVNEINLEINNPVYSVNNKYLAISEQNSSKLNLISNDKIAWSKTVDGNISKINVNNNGYVSVVVTGTTHKSVIIILDNNGNELFKIYRATTKALDTTISDDNKYLAFSEVNTSGTAIESSIKIISIEKAQSNPDESLIYTYTADNNSLIINIEYSGNDKIICMYDDKISIIQNESSSDLISLSEKGKNINFGNINLNQNVYRAVEENDGLFNTNTVLEIKSVNNDKLTVYTIEGAAKDIDSFNDVVAVNLGQEVEFINTSGWLLKRYSSTQEVQDVVLGNGIAGIIYKDRVELLNL